MTTKGQITIPLAVRKLLNARTGDWMVFEVDDDGTVRLRLDDYPNLDAMQGAAGSLDRALNWQEIREIAREDYLLEKTRIAQ